jgi:hypothetical protein
MTPDEEVEARRLAHLPQDIASRIRAGQQMVSEFYGPDGQMLSPDQIEQNRVAKLDGAQGGKPQEEQPSEGGPAPQEEQPPPQQPAPQEGAEEPWEQRYKSLQGLFNKMAGEQQRRDDEVSKLREQLEKVQTPPESVTAPVTADLAPLTDQERASVGDDELLEYAARHTFQKLLPRIKQLEDKIAGLEGGMKPIQQQVQHVQNETLFSQLDRRLPEWRQQNQDPKFIQWLNEIDPFSRIQRHLVLKQGVDAGDTDRVLTVFNTFKAETGTKTQTGASAAKPNGADNPQGTGKPNGTTSSRVPLDTLVHPGRVRSAGTIATQNATDEPPTVTRAELMQFRNDRARGVFRNNPDKLAEWEDYFNKAIAAGTVV